MPVIFNDLIGIPFLNRGRTLNGLDCWGLSIEVFKRFGIELPDYQINSLASTEIDEKVRAEKSVWIKYDPTNIPIPSLVVLKQDGGWCNHTGTYLGDGYFLHTLQKTGSVIERLDHPFWKRKIEGFYLPKGGKE